MAAPLGFSASGPALEIIAFMLHEQQFCLRTISIREIRGWAPVTPLPQAPPEVMGVMNLRGSVIPIVDLSVKLGMAPGRVHARSAVVVTNVGTKTIGLMVDRVSDILTVPAESLQPIPATSGLATSGYAQGIFAHEKQMICFLDLDAIFAANGEGELARVA